MNTRPIMDRTDRCRLQGGHRTVALVSLRCQTTAIDVVGHSRTDGTASLTLRPQCSLSTCNCTVILSVSASAGVFFGYSLLVRLSLLRPSCIMIGQWSIILETLRCNNNGPASASQVSTLLDCQFLGHEVSIQKGTVIVKYLRRT